MMPFPSELVTPPVTKMYLDFWDSLCQTLGFSLFGYGKQR